MNAVPDLRLILFKELQAILHVATASVMPWLNHFEAYWTVFPCETIHRAINQCSLCCEILLFSSPRVSVRDRPSLVPSKGLHKRGEIHGCLHHPSMPIHNQSLCAYSNTNALFLNVIRQQLLQGKVTRTIKGKDELGTCFLGQVLSLTVQQGFWNTAGYNGSIWKGDSQYNSEWDRGCQSENIYWNLVPSCLLFLPLFHLRSCSVERLTFISARFTFI